MKKFLRLFLILIIIVVIVWLCVFAIDYYRCSNLKMPIFVKAGQTLDDGGSGTYYGLGYKVQVEKYLSAEYGIQLERVEMYFLNKCIAASIAEIEKNEVEYEEKFKLTYYQRKDLGIKTIIDKNSSDDYDFSVYTYGGDVDIIIKDGDAVYSLKDALEQKVITVDDILKQAEHDAKRGICNKGQYLDGGSVEYRYSEYTILKCNDSFLGKMDFIIGMKGEILNKIDKLLYE